MQLFILYQTDAQHTTWTKTCFGIFSTKEKAIDAAKENDLYSYESDIVIEETTLDLFGEL